MAKINQDYLSFNPTKKGISTAELKRIRRSLAKAANQRMVRLERSTSVITGESYTSYGAYTIAQRYLQKSKGSTAEKLRFSETLESKQSTEAMQKDILELQQFLKAKTSRVAGQKQIEKLRMQTFESGRWGKGRNARKLKFASTKQFYDFISGDVFKKLSSVLSSEQILEIYDTAREDQSSSQIEEILLQTYEEFQAKEKPLTLREVKKKLGLALPGSANKKG